MRRARGAEARREGAGATAATKAVHPEHLARSRNSPRPSEVQLVVAPRARSPVPPEPPCETIRHRSHPERAGTGVRPYRTTHLPRRRPDRTNSAHHSPAAHAMGRPSRSARAAADFVPLRPGFDARPRQSWRSMSGGPGKPSGVTWRSQGHPPGPTDGPDGSRREILISGGREGVNVPR